MVVEVLILIATFITGGGLGWWAHARFHPVAPSPPPPIERSEGTQCLLFDGDTLISQITQYKLMPTIRKPHGNEVPDLYRLDRVNEQGQRIYRKQ